MEFEKVDAGSVQLVPLEKITKRSRLREVNETVALDIAASMREQGLLQPIVVRPVVDGFELVAGAHRLWAAQHLGWVAVEARVIVMDDDHARLAELDENLARAELTPAERARFTAERKRLYEAIYGPSKAVGARAANIAMGRCTDASDKMSFASATAKRSGVDKRVVQRDAARGEKIAGIERVVRTVLDKGEELDALAKLPREAQESIIARAQAGENVSARLALRQAARADKERALADKCITRALAEECVKYGVIYADPPWSFEVYGEGGKNRSAENHYPVMDLAAIKALPVPAASDAVLFLWATGPMMPQALEVLRAWGFEYRSQLVWVKPRAGTGYWARSSHELLLIGVSGDVPAPAPGMQPESVVEAPLGRHSEKPEIFAEIIEKMFPNLPKVELFSRSPRPGWAAMGNEMPSSAMGLAPTNEQEATL